MTSVGVQADTLTAVGPDTALSKAPFSPFPRRYGDGLFAFNFSASMGGVETHKSQKNECGGSHNEEFDGRKHVLAYSL